jgi:spermidine synthase
VVLIAALFFGSGMAGLIYEILWSRMLALIFGTTLVAVTTVLAAFMGGLALGSLLFGRLADRGKNLLGWYGLLEIGVGVYAFLVRPLFGWLRALAPVLEHALGGQGFAFHLIRFLLCFVALAVPTTLMGGTLPILSRLLARRRESLGKVVGWLYGLNTLGAVTGTFLAGFVLIRVWGIGRSLIVTGGLNLLIGMVAIGLGRHLLAAPGEEAGAAAGEDEVAVAGSRLPAGFIWAAYGLAGFAALGCEVAWTRALALVIGSSVYAFTIMLGTFLVGLALGGAVMGRFADRPEDRVQMFAAIEMGIAFTVLLSVVLIGRLPVLYLDIFFRLPDASFGLVQVVFVLLSGLVMFLPTFLMGAAFPVATRLVTPGLGRLGRRVGALYFVNTLGGILGAVVGGFLAIPTIGTRNSLILFALVFFGIGIAAWLLDRRFPLRRRVTTGALLGTLTLVFVGCIPPWERLLMTSGVYVYAPQMRDGFEADRKFLYYREGIHSLVAVTEKAGVRSLRINGKTDGSSGEDMMTQVLLAQLPLLSHPDPREVLVIGLGTGVTAGSALRHPATQAVCLEIDPAVIEAAAYFEDINGRALENPALRIVQADARTWLDHTDQRYDVIISEPSNPWITGVSNLFTLEHFQACARVLRRDGVICQWIHSYFMPLDALKTIIRTFVTAFPSATLWQASEGDLLLLAGRSPDFLRNQSEIMAARWTPGAIEEDLRRVGLEEPRALLARLLLDAGELKRFAGAGPLNRDDRPVVEFISPFAIYRDTHHGNRRAIMEQQLLSRLGSAAGP